MIWTNIKNIKPLAYKSGDWDGLKSDKILVFTKCGNLHIAVMYEGILDGNGFCDFYDDNDIDIKDVIFWADIDSPI